MGEFNRSHRLSLPYFPLRHTTQPYIQLYSTVKVYLVPICLHWYKYSRKFRTDFYLSNLDLMYLLKLALIFRINQREHKFRNVLARAVQSNLILAVCGKHYLPAKLLN